MLIRVTSISEKSEEDHKGTCLIIKSLFQVSIVKLKMKAMNWYLSMDKALLFDYQSKTFHTFECQRR